uniref:Mos1 transposase HTH domain-containing protein n=1 Tax=Globodera rostochiensis TaxID=31243 RepID=A0A914GQP3_GLORO
MEPQVDKNEHFRYLFLFEFNKGSKASEASQNICAVYGEGATNERTAQRWFVRFREGVFDLKNTPHTGRRSAFDEERLNGLRQHDKNCTPRAGLGPCPMPSLE